MQCQQCGGRAQLPLCPRCVAQFEQMLGDLGWLVRQLEITAERQDRLNTGGARGSEHPLPANMSAIELLRSVSYTLRWLVDGMISTVLPTAAPSTVLIWWLQHRLDELARRGDAARCYQAVQDLVGASGHGPIHDVINRCDRVFCGDCPDCGELCYAWADDVYTTCAVCGAPLDVERNQLRALAEYDLLPERALFTVLDNLGEHVSRVRFYAWVSAGKLPPAGYLGPDGIVVHRGAHRAPRVYSLSRVRALRRREQSSQPVLA